MPISRQFIILVPGIQWFVGKVFNAFFAKILKEALTPILSVGHLNYIFSVDPLWALNNL